MDKRMSEKELGTINETVKHAQTHLENNAKYRADYSFDDYDVKIYTISAQNTVRIDIKKRIV